MNPLENAVASGVRANDDLAKMFSRLGVGDNQAGIIATVYRNGLRALRSALTESDIMTAAADVLVGMRSSLASGLRSELAAGQQFGIEEAARQLMFYDVGTRPDDQAFANLRAELDAALASILARFDAQAASVNAILLTGVGVDLILGDEDRTGTLRASDIMAAAAFWLPALSWDAWSWWTLKSKPPEMQFKKQVVAALDERTTECCLRAHGQIQPLNRPFELVGTPRFADKIDWPPFHWYCRTSVVLYNENFDLGVTYEMQQGAAAILAERQAGQSGYRHPADAFA